MSNYFAIMSLKNNNPETLRDVQTNPLTVTPPEDNNHGTVNPSDGKPIDENIPSIGSPANHKGDDINHEDGKSCLASISGNFENYNDSRKSQHHKFWTFYDFLCDVFFNCFHRLLGHLPRYRHAVISVGDRDNDFLSGGFLLLATCCSFCWKYR